MDNAEKSIFVQLNEKEILLSDIESETCKFMAQVFKEKGQDERAITCLEKVNDADSYEKLGEYYYKGEGTRVDKIKAKEYFKKAADAENPNTDAMCNYAMLVNDPSVKFEYYKKAALRGVAYAMNMAGVVMETYGLKDDNMTLIDWYKKAADELSYCGCINYINHCNSKSEKEAYLRKARIYGDNKKA